MAHPTERRSLLYVYDSATDAWIPAKGDADGNLYMELEAGDLEIGAVEIKDATTATRAVVDADGLEVHIDKAIPAGTAVIGIVRLQDVAGNEAKICPSMEALKVKQAQKAIHTCESIVGWTGSTDVSGIATDVQHRGPGTVSIEFDKDGTTQAYATMASDLTAINGKAYGTHGRIEYYLYIAPGDLAGISSVYMGLGTDVSNYFYWQTDVADLVAGWQHIQHVLSAIDGQVGNGADMEAITWVRLFVTLSATGTTLTDMRFDDIRLVPIDGVTLIDPEQTGIHGTFDVNDISKGTQTNDVAVTLDSEAVVLGASETHVGEVGGNGDVVAATFTRPANVTAYASKDTVSDSTGSPTVLTFTNVARVNAGTGYIVKARIMTDQSTNVARYRLHLYNVAPTAINDNAAWTLLWANKEERIGHIDFDGCQTEGTGSDCANAVNATVRLHFAAATRTLYGLLETLDAFTPASGQNYYIELSAELD